VFLHEGPVFQVREIGGFFEAQCDFHSTVYGPQTKEQLHTRLNGLTSSILKSVGGSKDPRETAKF
jgi:hypothetical protein